MARRGVSGARLCERNCNEPSPEARNAANPRGRLDTSGARHDRSAVRSRPSPARPRSAGPRSTRRKGQAVISRLEASSSPNFARATYWPIPGEATSSPSSTRTLPRRSTVSGRADDLGALVEVVVDARVLGRRRDRHPLLGIEDHDVGVRADRERALARVEAEELRRVRREQLDHPVERDPAAADAEVVDHLQPVLEPRPAVRDLREVVAAERLLPVPA